MARTVGISRSFICEKSSKFLFKFSISATTTITSGVLSDLEFSSVFRTIVSSKDVGLML